MIFVLLAITCEEDLELVDELFKKYNKELYSISMSIVHDKNNAEEALQEAFIRIIDKIQRIQKIPRPEMIKFCVVIVKNISVDILRKKSKVTYLEDLGHLPDAEIHDVEDDFIRKEDTDTLLRALDKLSSGDRQLIRLRWGEGISFKQMGALLGITDALANKRTQRAVRKLREAMGKEDSFI